MENIIIKPILTEKMAELGEKLNRYAFEVRRDVKGAKAKLADAEGYIRHMRHYLKYGDWCNDFYGPYEDKRIKWQTIVPKG